MKRAMNRRLFLASCLALGAAPAIVRASSLMRMVPTESGLLVPSRRLLQMEIGGEMFYFVSDVTLDGFRIRAHQDGPIIAVAAPAARGMVGNGDIVLINPLQP